jgi:hypothetical protein
MILLHYTVCSKMNIFMYLFLFTSNFSRPPSLILITPVQYYVRPPQIHQTLRFRRTCPPSLRLTLFDFFASVRQQ